MKRFWIALTIMLALVTFSCYSMLRVRYVSHQLSDRLDTLIILAEEDHTAALLESAAFVKEWDQAQKTLIRLVGHAQLGEISGLVARLTALASHDTQESGEFLAELYHIRSMVDHIWEAEAPTLRNLF